MPERRELFSILLVVTLILAYIPPITYTAKLNEPPSFKQLTYPVAIVGDYDNEIYNLLLNNGFTSDELVQYTDASSLLNDLFNGQLFSLVIFNRWSSSSDAANADELLSFIKAIDVRDIPMLILDAAYIDHTAGDQFYNYRNELTDNGYPAPVDQVQHYPSQSYVVVDPVNASHPIFNGVNDPYYLGTPDSSHVDYMTYPDFTLPVQRLA